MEVITYDLDYTIGKTYENFGGVEGYEYNMFDHVMDRNDVPNSLFITLLKNEEFKEKFRNVFKEYANKVLSLNKANELVNEYKVIFPEMIANGQTRWWGYFGGTKLETFSYCKNNFLSNVLSEIKKFFEERAKYALEDIEEFLN